jgi:hypothetical protein
VTRRIETSVGSEVKSCKPPKQALEALKRLPAGDADAINNFLVKVIAKLLARVAARLSNLRFKLLLDLI